jgi:chromosome segregation protein
MTDVIFNGSTERKPVSQASVELVFSNTEGRLQGQLADRSEISVKRAVTKDAVSTYFLNGTKCRRRDITDIFLGTGLGPRSYAIIEQGMISRLIESKPQELRVFLEEAAGISKYKERRRETETRIKHTRENLERLADVREELGSQLEKLKRQAATARRYKELKTAERRYKAELTALKWHKYNEQLNFHESQRLKKETELEAFIAEQRGGELGLLTKKEQLQSLNDIAQQQQQNVFQTSNQITRIEQHIVFEQQQKTQFQQQLEQLQSSLSQAQQQIEFEQVSKLELEQQSDLLEAEQELSQAKLEAAQHKHAESEALHEQQQSRYSQQIRELSNAQQACKLLETKIHHQQIELAKNKQQSSDIQSELHELANKSLKEAIAQHSQTVAELNESIEILKEQQFDLIKNENQSEQEFQQHSQQVSDAKQALSQSEIKLEQLQQWQQEFEISTLTASQASSESLYDTDKAELLISQLRVEPKWQSAVEQLLSHHGNPILIDALPETELLDNIQLVTRRKVTSKKSSSDTNATAGDVTNAYLTDAIIEGEYPSWFESVVLADDLSAANKLLETAAHVVLLPSGQWLGKNWTGKGGVHASQQSNLGVLSRIEQIEKLTKLVADQRVAVDKLEQENNGLNQKYQNDKSALQHVEKELSDKKQQFDHSQLELRLLQQQAEHHNAQQLKLSSELTDLHEQTAQNELTLEMFNEELLLAQELELELQTKGEDFDHYKEKSQLALADARQQVDNATHASHQISLKQQTITSQYENVCQNITRAQTHIEQLKTRLNELHDNQGAESEKEALLAEELESHLEQQLLNEEALRETNSKIALLNEELRLLEQGQSGIMAKLDGMKEVIAEIKMDCEGARVRAQNMLDILIDMDQKLKDILEALPAEAEEETWAQNLEKTTQTIQRLGAINLAAIDEYEIQAERKGYLDEQYDDLNKALETLEAAIRKIDRESRSKFKDTYDQVNDGLKTLFPKVFGGGMAYLELTDDDLLNTGVTIMARPPGKKNSTIHLLSGGEKALTALSLVFSIFRLNPAPFCMLDEVDAPLDDANVGRFCKLVNEMSDTVQFIYISHNKVAMEMATHLTGVTMHEPGVSRLVAVDIQQAVEMAEAS